MKGVLEGLLYVEGDLGITLEQVSEILNISLDSAKDLVLSLKEEYIKEDRGLRINFLGNSIKLTTKEEHKEYFQKLLESPKNNVLSPQALETLAIIAYNEPITRMQIDEYRGVDSIYVLRRLLAKGLVKECGRSDLPGRPILYKTTDEFLDYFNLSSKDDLPKIELLEENDEEKDLYTSNYKE
ncbi:MAG: SMC-Scp complex subunit ScpB [Bacilli bacterium]|jgi:segregation and condensation protein B|nr:SMC-Scp complex subunit ScpB [Clostridium sp.]MDY3797845.1 SMC-Scp complex subunit ScpB [Bacilli bacterium]